LASYDCSRLVDGWPGCS